MKQETNAIHAGYDREDGQSAVNPPIFLSTTFERAADGEYPLGWQYGRNDNPNRAMLEARLGALEGGAVAYAFASGSVTFMTLLQALTPADHVVAPDDLYFGIRVLLQDVFVPWGLNVSFVDTTDTVAVAAAMRPNTRLVMVETPSNPLMKVTDIAAVAGIAHDAGALLVVDNTFATPILQHPLALGADLVVHSTTKYLGGHHDATGGIIIAREQTDLSERVGMLQRYGGAVPSPFECWLVLRGTQTLPTRIRAHGANAMRVAEYLEGHPKVEAVYYAGLPAFAGHDVARRQMDGFGGMMSVLIKGGQEAAMSVAACMRVFTRATSFGSPHSLIEHRASVEAEGSTTPLNLLRLSIGLEHIDDLLADLEQALDF